MKVASEKGTDTSAGYTKPRLVQLENTLQELRRYEEYKRQQSDDNASVAVKHKLLNDQLLQTQDELAAAQANTTKLCGEIGTLKQTKEHQAKQLKKYKFDLQAARETHAAMVKKMEELETSTWTIKQQYIRSLASRIKTSALVLQQLNVKNGTAFSARDPETISEWEQHKPKKRKRTIEESENQQEVGGSSKPKQAGIAAGIESQTQEQEAESIVVEQVTAAQPNHAVASLDHNGSLPTDHTDQQDDYRVETEHQIAELQAQVANLESEHSALNDKCKALERQHDKVLADSKTFTQEIEAKDSKIEELMQMLELSRSKQPVTLADSNSTNDEAKEVQEGRLKMLEENLAQMNGYADQLEMVIAQCPSCTIKLQNESTQDSITSKASLTSKAD